MYTKKELNAFAKQFIKVNNIMNDAIMLAENFVHSDMFQEIMNNDEEENAEIFKIMVEYFNKIKNKDNNLARPEIAGNYFQDFESFVDKFEEYVEEN